jgi:phospholipid/cholesterol/gamma-HCH transport system substrate-binding protein
MAERSKVRWSQLKVGIVALASLAILAVLIFLLTTSKGLFQKTVILRTYMDDASGMADGTPVRLNGITIGNLDAVRLTNSTDPKRTVEFQMSVKEKFLPDIPVDSVAGISAANLLGDKFINITKGKSPQHVKPGDELRSLQTQDIPELMAQSANLLQSFQGIVNRVDSMLKSIDAGQGNLGKLLRDEELYTRLNGIAAEGQKLLSDVRNGKGTLSKLLYDDALYNDIRSPLHRIDAMLADLQAGQGSAGKLMKDPALYDEARATIVEIRRILADVNAGKGTAGKLLKDEHLHAQLTLLLTKFDTTLDKINAGQGTLGQLVVNPQLYESLNGATHEFQSLARDIRANPKKFLSLRLALF